MLSAIALSIFFLFEVFILLHLCYIRKSRMSSALYIRRSSGRMRCLDSRYTFYHSF